MRSICGSQIVPPTEKSAKYVLLFKILMVFQLLIAIMDIVAHGSFLREGIFGIFFLYLIFNAFYKLSYSTVLIYTFASLFFSVIFLVYILTMYQYSLYLESRKARQQPICRTSGVNTIWLWLVLVLCSICSTQSFVSTLTENSRQFNIQIIQPFMIS